MAMSHADKVAAAKKMHASQQSIAQLVSASSAVNDALKSVVPDTVVADDATASKLVGYMPEWRVGMKLEKDKYFVDPDSGDLYHIMQDGTAQAQYKPGMAGLESLFVKVQMRNGHRVYNPSTVGYDYINTGDIVAFYNEWLERWEYYESKINGNTVSPDAEDSDRWWTYLGTEDELYGA